MSTTNRLLNVPPVVIAADLPYDQRIQAFLDAARSRAEQGFTLAEIGRTFLDFVVLAVDTARELLNEGAEKKQFVMAGADRLFEYLWPAVPFPVYLMMLKPVVKSTVKRIVMTLVDGIIEAVYAFMKRKIPAPIDA